MAQTHSFEAHGLSLPCRAWAWRVSPQPWSSSQQPRNQADSRGQQATHCSPCLLGHPGSPSDRTALET